MNAPKPAQLNSKLIEINEGENVNQQNYKSKWFVTLISFFADKHSTMTKTISCRQMRAHNIAAFNILRHCGRHVNSLEKKILEKKL